MSRMPEFTFCTYCFRHSSQYGVVAITQMWILLLWEIGLVLFFSLCQIASVCLGRPGRGLEYCDDCFWLFVCVSVRLSVCLFVSISAELRVHLHQICMHLPMAMAWFSSVSVAICCVLPVLWIMSCSHYWAWWPETGDVTKRVLRVTTVGGTDVTLQRILQLTHQHQRTASDCERSLIFTIALLTKHAIWCVRVVTSDVVLEAALPCLEAVFDCLSRGSASSSSCLGLASVSNQVPRSRLSGLLIVGSASARSQSFRLGLASASTVMTRVWDINALTFT